MKITFNKYFGIGLSGLLICLGLSMNVYNDHKIFQALQEKGRHLSRFDPSPADHLADGQIRLINARRYKTMNIYTYWYTFQHQGHSYQNEIAVYKSIWRTSYFPAPVYQNGPVFTEQILFDPDNPSINLPAQYARLLPSERNPFFHLFVLCAVMGLIGIVGIVAGVEIRKSTATT